MSMVFKFRMMSDENDAFVRDYEVMYDATLLDLHHYICADLGYDDSGMTSFFTSNSEWERLREFTLEDMGEVGEDAALPMESVTLGQVLHKNRDRLIYLFDMFGNRAYYLELTGAVEAEADVKYPRTTNSNGAPSDQYDPTIIPDDGGSMFDDAMGDFYDFEGDDAYDDDLY